MTMTVAHILSLRMVELYGGLYSIHAHVDNALSMIYGRNQ